MSTDTYSAGGCSASSRMRVLALEPLPGSIRRRPGPNRAHECGRALGEDRGLGARQVVLGQLADAVEERASRARRRRISDRGTSVATRVPRGSVRSSRSPAGAALE